MDWQIRIALIVIGIMVIGYIVFDYRRRKYQSVEKEKLIQQMRESAQQVDSAGFDFTGVGNVRVADKNQPDETMRVSDCEEQTGVTVDEVSDKNTLRSHSEVLESNKSKSNASKSYSSESLTNVVSSSDSIQKENEKNHLTEQMSMDVSDNSQLQTSPELVMSLILRAQGDVVYAGKDFMPLLLSQGLRHGDMGIFHRHSGAAGKPGPIMYSVANAINPGTFDIQNIETFTTPAFAFFMTVPGPVDPVKAYENMVNTVRLLKQELGGQILDETKSVFTEQTYQHQLEVLKAYLAKSRVAH
ncbi:cell division protein ZipA [Aliikangiella maris]|uniref:Cell division protein ZipA n=2 Tax=Aliikangiella maris TaxID=3162458 RepID=A0ABV3MIB3_9GAMM